MKQPAFDTEESAATFVIALDYLTDLFTASSKDVFTKTDVLILLNLVRNDPELVSPEAVLQIEADLAAAGINEPPPLP